MGSDAVLFEMVSTARSKVKGQRSKAEKMKLIVAVLISCVFAAAPASAQVDLTGTWQRVGASDNGAAREPREVRG